MAETFLALRRGLHGGEQRVCLKRVLPAFAADPSFLRQFQREASIASTLRHTGIVSVVEFGDVDGTQYLALELVDGVDLRDYVASRPGRVLPHTLVARLALDLGYALHYAHGPAHGVVHRDVSPANVMLSRTGEIKLTDFGVARVMSNAAPTTSTGVRGKIAYMAPEQIRGEELDGRADLFALGVLLFECLCGQRPFQGAHDVETMRRIAEGERPHVRELAPEDTPPALLSAIEGLLSVDRASRTPSAEALIEQLALLPGLHQARRRLGREVDELRGGLDTREHVSVQREEVGDTRLDHVPAMTLGLQPGAKPGAALREASETVLLAPEPPAAASPKASLEPPGRRRGVGLSLGVAALSLLLVGGAWLATSSAPRSSVPPAATVTAALGSAPNTPVDHESAATPPAGQPPLGPATTVARAQGAAASSAGGQSNPAASAATPEAATSPGAREAATSPGAPEAAAAAAAREVASPPAAHAVAADSASTGSAAPSPAAADTGAPPAEDGARPGTLRVIVESWGEVWVNGRYMGRAPVDVTLRPGRHNVAVGEDGPTVRRTVQVESGRVQRARFRLN